MRPFHETILSCEQRKDTNLCFLKQSHEIRTCSIFKRQVSCNFIQLQRVCICVRILPALSIFFNQNGNQLKQFIEIDLIKTQSQECISMDTPLVTFRQKIVNQGVYINSSTENSQLRQLATESLHNWSIWQLG